MERGPPYYGPPQHEHYRRPRRGCLLLTALIIIIVAFFLLLIGFVTPGWTYTEDDNLQATTGISTSAHMGLWYLVVCVETSTNTDCASGSTITLDTDFLLKFRIMATISLIASVIAVILDYGLRHPSHTYMKVLTIAICIISGVLAIATAADYGNDLVELDDAYDSLTIDSPYMFPYSLFMFGLGGLLIFIAAILLIIEICQTWRHWEDDKMERPSHMMHDPYQPQAYPMQPAPYYADGGNPYPPQPPQPRHDPYYTPRHDPHPVKHHDPYPQRSYDPYDRREPYRQRNIPRVHAPSHRDTRGYEPDYRSSRSHRYQEDEPYVVSVGRQY